MSQVTIPGKGGESFGAYFVEAAGKEAPGIVLVQEIFGVNASLRAAADHWAAQGYHVVCPDLFWRGGEPGVQLDPTQPEEFSRGVGLMQRLDEDTVVSDLESTRQWLAEKIGSDRIAAVGYCWGGRLVVRMAADTGIKCAVSYYGVGLEQLVPATAATAVPALIHIAELDSYVPAAARQAILADVEKRAEWEAYVYAGCDHAFARPGGVHRDDAATRLAEERSLAFMQKHLGAD